MDFTDSINLELIKAGIGLIFLAVGWFIGQRIVAYWDIKKKRQELAIETATQFHKLYGEFKEISRLWRAFCYEDKKLNFPDTVPVELLGRAASAEGGVEAIIVNLATERVLEDKDIKTLGLFRQAYQKLREAIRDMDPLEWTYEKPEYKLYNELASKVACIIATNEIKSNINPDDADKLLEEITKIRSDDWEDIVKELIISSGNRNVS